MEEITDGCQVIRGCPFPAVHWFSAKNVEDAMDYVPGNDDVIIASYPKTGTTWMQYIVLQITSKGEYFPTFDDVTYKVVPFIEMSGIAAVEALQCKPRIYKHHISYDLVQKNPKSKYIYTYRHPEDTFVSYYHFGNSLQMSDTFDRSQFDAMYESFLSGKIGYGSYFRHVLSFYEHHQDEGLLMVSYEKLQSNRKEEVLRIAKFLGREYYECLTQDEEVLSKVLEHTTFEYMKKNLYLTHPGSKKEVQSSVDSANEPKKVNFFRKGIVGDGRSVLTDEQRERIKAEAQKVLKGTSILDEWYPK